MCNSDNAPVRPFVATFPDEALVELRRRIDAARWPEKETVPDRSQGVQLATIQALARYWATDYDWRQCEARLHSFPQFVTAIDGLDVHFVHLRSKHPDALPLLITHGWPGTIVEQLKILEPLTDPTSSGGRPEDAFDVVVPSLPGFGFSGKPSTTGWDPARIARAWSVLMRRLGYSRYVAQGTDWGAIVTEQLAVRAPPGLLAIHTNMPGAVPPELDAAARAGAPPPDDLPADERREYDKLASAYRRIAYATLLGSRPQTLVALADSPVGLAAFLLGFLLDHDVRSYERIAHGRNGKCEGLTRDDLLDSVTLFWLTSSAISAARLYWENELDYFAPKGITIPVAVSAFPDELYTVPRRWAERAYPKLIHHGLLDRGGHFPAWELPELLVAELRAAFRPLRGAA